MSCNNSHDKLNSKCHGASILPGPSACPGHAGLTRFTVQVEPRRWRPPTSDSGHCVPPLPRRPEIIERDRRDAPGPTRPPPPLRQNARTRFSGHGKTLPSPEPGMPALGLPESGWLRSFRFDATAKPLSLSLSLFFSLSSCSLSGSLRERVAEGDVARVPAVAPVCVRVRVCAPVCVFSSS